MIFMHELGHYLTAKSAGMKVTEFFLGFGPRIWSFHKGETEYGLKAIPAGAYVRIIGMHNLDPVAPEDEPRAYKNQPYWRKMSVASAGSMMHFIMAFVLLFCLFAFYGQQKDCVWTVGSLSRLGDTQTSPAIAAGHPDRRQDRRRSTAPRCRLRPGGRPDPGAARPDGRRSRYERDGQTFETTATLEDHNPEGKAVGFLGVGCAPSVRAPVRCSPRRRTRSTTFTRADVGVDQGARVVLLAERSVATTSTRCSAGLQSGSGLRGVGSGAVRLAG